MALEALSLVGDILVSKNSSAAGGGPEWLVTFLNNAGNLPLLEADSAAMWGGVTVVVDEERAGTSESVSGSFELRASGNDSESVIASYDASATEVRTRSRHCWHSYLVRTRTVSKILRTHDSFRDSSNLYIG